jgi:hypothetical protein
MSNSQATMRHVLALGFLIAGSLAGFFYTALGMSASKHLRGTDEVDKTFGWTLMWSLEPQRYDAQGQRLCRKGAWVLASTLACWALGTIFWTD